MGFIKSIGTATPENKISQARAEDFMTTLMGKDELSRRMLSKVHSSSKIDTRYSVIQDFNTDGESDFFKNTEPPSVEDRMKLFKDKAVTLSAQAVMDCLKNSSTGIEDITHLITISCTGMYAPGLDIELIKELGLKPNIERYCINFMGCYAAFNGIKMANHICASDKSAKVLIVCCELCTIHFQKEFTEDNILANAIFGDGAACVLMEPDSFSDDRFSLEIKSTYCDLAFKGENSMAWYIKNTGFQIVLSSYIPALVRDEIQNLLNNVTGKLRIKKEDISFYAVHPGGKRILEAIEQSLDLKNNELELSYRIMRDYGNMSSCSVLFVLKELMKNISVSDKGKNIFSCAFGPGLTLESIIYKIA